MEKHLIISGPRGSGKTIKAYQIAAPFQPFDVPFTSATKPSSVFKKIYKACKTNTRLIVFDEFVFFSEHDLVLLSDLAEYGFPVKDKKTKELITINPRIIATGQDLETYFKLYPELLKNFELVEMTGKF